MRYESATEIQHTEKLKTLRFHIACLSSTHYIAMLCMFKHLTRENFKMCEPLVTAALLGGVVEHLSSQSQSSQFLDKNLKNQEVILLSAIKNTKIECLKTAEDARLLKKYLLAPTAAFNNDVGSRLNILIIRAQILVFLLTLALGFVQNHHGAACTRAQKFRFTLIGFARAAGNTQAEIFFRNAFA